MVAFLFVHYSMEFERTVSIAMLPFFSPACSKMESEER